MNISEANAVNVLLDRLFVIERRPVDQPTEERVYEAARFLADKAHKALYAGWNPALLDDSEFRQEQEVMFCEAHPDQFVTYCSEDEGCVLVTAAIVRKP